jgi:hypothetical protein
MKRYYVDFGYGRGYLGETFDRVPLAHAREFAWDEALEYAQRLRRMGFVGAEVVPVTITPSLELAASQS